MKIYRAWTNSNHKIQYTLGYFLSLESAIKAISGFGQAASSPEAGVEEIAVLP
jgi:hypothetical protein